jgi:tetratricopeptide (TPR) repeat protein
VREEDYQAVDAMLSRFETAPLSMRLLPAFARGDSAARERFIRDATVSDNRQSQIAARYVATFLEDFDTAESIARLDLAERRRPPIRLGSQMFLAWLELARGRWAAADTAFERAMRMEGASAVEFERAIGATLPFLQVPRVDLARIRSEIERTNPIVTPMDAATGLATTLRPHLRLYLLSLLSTRLGDDQTAVQYANELAALAAPAGAAAVVHGLAQTARADVALRNGRPAEALALLEQVPGDVPLELVFQKAFATVREYGLEHTRYLRAEALFAQKRWDDALRWYRTSFQGSPAELVYLAPSHLRRAQIFEATGERDRAATHYRRVVRLWSDADPALRATVEQANARLAALRERHP